MATLTPSQRPVTLRELANHLGVHPSTVSRVLNGDPQVRISDATRARILELATETNYRPNRLARSLKLQRTGIIGMLIPDITNPLFAALFQAVEAAAAAASYHVILCNTDESAIRLERHLETLSEGHVDGLVIATATVTDDVVEAVRARGLPYVLVHRRRDAPDDSFLVPDDELGARLAVEHLASLGHRRIALVGGSGRVSRGAARAAGFAAAIAAYGGVGFTWFPESGGIDETAGEQAFLHFQSQPPPERPTAYFAANDLAAMGIIAAARGAGLDVPRDLSVVGCDDIPAGRYINPPLTTIRLPLRDMGNRAIAVLLRKLDQPAAGNSSPTREVLPVELIPRGSTAPPPRI